MCCKPMSPPHCFDRQINFPFSLVRIDLKKMATDLVDSADDTQTGQRSHVRGMAESTELKSSQPLPIERSFPVPSGGRHFSFTFRLAGHITMWLQHGLTEIQWN
jgi:hypothetical protein